MGIIHLDGQDPFPIGRQPREVRHASFPRRHVDIALAGAAVGSGHEGHLHAALDFGEQHMLVIDPRETFRVGQHEAWLAAQDRHHPRFPVVDATQDRIGNLRAIGRECWGELLVAVMREFDRRTIGKHLDIELAWGKKRPWTPNVRQHVPIG